MIIRGRTSKTGLAILGCCLASVAWAGATAAAPEGPVSVLAPFDSVRLSAWLLFGVALVTRRNDDSSRLGRLYFFGALTFCVAAVGYDGYLLVVNPAETAWHTPQLLVRIGFGVLGLLAVENLWRNTEAPTLARLAVVSRPRWPLLL